MRQLLRLLPLIFIGLVATNAWLTVHVPRTYSSRLKTPFLSNKYQLRSTNSALASVEGSSSKENEKSESNPSVASKIAPTENDKKRNNLLSRCATGIALSAAATLWAASDTRPFSFVFLVVSFIAQKEYFAMVKATGVEPARKISFLSSILCFVSAALAPKYHELVMPLSSVMLTAWLLIVQKKSPSIYDMSASLLGMLYLGYLPSFWVRLRGVEQKWRVTSSLFGLRDGIFVNLEQSALTDWTLGAKFIWWTWVAVATADISAFFVGKTWGRTKLASVSLAAGAASPNKSIEGVIGGWLGCSMIAVIAAYRMQWPWWFATGVFYGLSLTLLALLGDLAASMMKRDAKIKDSGTLLPGHGGILDRLDSYIFTAPFAYFYCVKLLPLVWQWRSSW